jgi:hypothetical protein
VTKEFSTRLETTLRAFYEEFKEKFRLAEPALSGQKGVLYMPKPPAIEAMHRHKLDLTFR